MVDFGTTDGEGPYVDYSATLRIFGQSLDLDGISSTLVLRPTYVHRRGSRAGPGSPPREHDMWSYSAPVPEERPLHVHVSTLWSHIRAHRDYLVELKRTCSVDVFLGYRSNSQTAGIEVPPDCLAMFIELDIPLGLSIIVM